ncbi:mechanosensitive ion channel family protein [candidate division KSB1 bacterium]|nr:mechanosensitive ion channel family protein [candidate division KSB1 bacterium]
MKQSVENIRILLVSGGFKILMVFIGTILVLMVVNFSAHQITMRLSRLKLKQDSEKRVKTIISVARQSINILTVIIAIITALGILDIDIAPILTAAGIAGVALGFGAQSLVKDIISGFFILLDDQIRVGDVVEVAGKAGVVEKINLRQVVLRDLEGCVHYIHNSAIEVITNKTQKFSFAVFDINIAYRENVERVIGILEQISVFLRQDENFQKDIMEDIEVFGLDQFADSAIVIKARIKTKPGSQWKVRREFNKRVKATFDRENIEIPFPHLKLYLSDDASAQITQTGKRQTNPSQVKK